MATDRKELMRGLKYELIAFPLILIAPVLITIGFKTLKQENNYLWLVLGIFIAISAIIIGFLGIRILLNAFFSRK